MKMDNEGQRTIMWKRLMKAYSRIWMSIEGFVRFVIAMSYRAVRQRRFYPLGARCAVFAIYISVIITVLLARIVRSACTINTSSCRRKRSRLLVCGTFYNPGWFRSHVAPLSACRSLDKVLVICDEPVCDMPRVVYRCPPEWLVRRCGRSIARFFWVFWIAWQERPEYLMGYHIMPNALLCLVTASILGGSSIYQMTGGPIQVIGGGAGSENVLLTQLGRPSLLLESLLFHILRQFDLIVVRGSRAREFLHRHRLARSSMVLTGSVDVQQFKPNNRQPVYDLICVARLIPEKGLEFLLETAGHLRRCRSHFKLAVVGGGPLRTSLGNLSMRLGIQDNVVFLGKRSDIADLLQKGRLFVLMSPSEGMSIAMLEAMGAGLPVAVTNVGDLADAVEGKGTGVFVSGNDAAAAADTLNSILQDEEKRMRMSRSASSLIRNNYSIGAISEKWEEYFDMSDNVILERQ